MAATCGTFSSSSMSHSEVSSSCSQHSTPFLGSYVPSFVKEAVSIQKFELVRHGSEGIVDFKIYFTAKSLQSKAEFDRIQGNNSADDKSNKIIVRGRSLPLCDGPCGRNVQSADVVQFGDCDHIICNDCMKGSLAKTLYDGSPCCCNESCLRKGSRSRTPSRATSRNPSLRSRNSTRQAGSSNSSASKKKREKKKGEKRSSSAGSSSKTPSDSKTSSQKTDKKKRKKRKKRSDKSRKDEKSRSSRASSSLSWTFVRSLPGTNTIVKVNVLAYSLGNRKLLRHTLQMELLGNTLMGLVMDKVLRMMAANPADDKNKWYYTVKEKFRRKELIPIQPKTLAQMTASQLAGSEEVLSVVVAGPGTCI